MKRTPMKRKGRKRQIPADHMDSLKQTVKERDNGICIGKTAGIKHECGPVYDPEHLVEQRDIRKKCGPASDALVDPRLAAYCCRNLNSALFFHNPLVTLVDAKDPGDLTLEDKDTRARAAIRSVAPEGFEEAVEEYGLQSPADRKLGAL